jgi:hypothetical protein
MVRRSSGKVFALTGWHGCREMWLMGTLCCEAIRKLGATCISVVKMHTVNDMREAIHSLIQCSSHAQARGCFDRPGEGLKVNHQAT